MKRRVAANDASCSCCNAKRCSTPAFSSKRRRRKFVSLCIPILFLMAGYSLINLNLEGYRSPFSNDTIGLNLSTVKQKAESPKVLYTVFAGRKNRLLLQEPYWAEMYNIGAINELHLWHFIPHDDSGETKGNRKYLYSLPQKYPFITIMEPSSVPMNETKWFDFNSTFRDRIVEVYANGSALLTYPNERCYSEYYKYYSINPWDGVIIKADDDIVYINTTMVKPYVDYLWTHPRIFLLSASVVNQGLCAYYQQKLGGAIPEAVIPTEFPDNGMGAIHTNATQAFRLHQHFLASEENRRKFFIAKPEFVSFHGTAKMININFFAIRGDAWHETWELVQDMLNVSRLYYDEGALTARAIVRREKIEGIYLPLVVAHASYTYQKQLHHEILSLWADWARKERADLYGNLLDEWVSPGEYQKRLERQAMSKFVQEQSGQGHARMHMKPQAPTPPNEDEEKPELTIEAFIREG